MITHVVLLGLTDAADCPEALDRLRALPAQIPELLTLRCGQALAESTGGGPTLTLITEHNDQAGLDAYQNHPIHQEFLAWIRPRLTTRSVVDTDDFR